MSIINDRLGNASWQLKVLRGLSEISDSLVTANNDYEDQIVQEICAGVPTRVLLEIRVFNNDTGQFGAPEYYVPGSSTPTTLGAGCTVTYVTPSGPQLGRSPSILRIAPLVIIGSSTPVAYSVSFANTHATANASVMGAVIKPGEVWNFDAGAPHNMMQSIPYDTAAGGELLIIMIVA